MREASARAYFTWAPCLRRSCDGTLNALIYSYCSPQRLDGGGKRLIVAPGAKRQLTLVVVRRPVHYCELRSSAGSCEVSGREF